MPPCYACHHAREDRSGWGERGGVGWFDVLVCPPPKKKGERSSSFLLREAKNNTFFLDFVGGDVEGQDLSMVNAGVDIIEPFQQKMGIGPEGGGGLAVWLRSALSEPHTR